MAEHTWKCCPRKMNRMGGRNVKRGEGERNMSDLDP